jgi:hypothetical protein
LSFDLGQECANILAELPDTLPDHSKAHNSNAAEMSEFMRRSTALLAELQGEFPSLAGKRLGGVSRLYLYDPSAFIETLERDVVTHWLQHPESLELTAWQVGAMASNWYGQPVTEHRIKRRFKNPELTPRIQQLCYEHGNAADLSRCRSLPEIQKRLRLRAQQSAERWNFRHEITFYANGSVTIGNKLAKQDITAAGKKRVRGNGSAVAVNALRNILLAHS